MNKKFGRILVVDDNEDILLAARLLLKPHVERVHTEKDPRAIPSLLKDERYDVILLDMNFTQDATSGAEGFHWLSRILETDPSAVVILITAYGDVETAVRAIKEGATDFVLKPWQNEKLLATLSAALSLRESRLEVDHLRSRERQLSADIDRPFHDLIGASAVMQEVFATIQKVAQTDANVLILGENGTGKELVARALHRQSRRAEEVFITVDVGALSETLFESELFGHVKGAFTDAKEDRAGRFEIASGGTLFLDEIGNLPLPLQAKLLTALENRQVTRLGANAPQPIDVRLICATNTPIHDVVAQRQFRQDLLYRVNTVEIRLPPLRERAEDIPLLVDHFLKVYSKKYQKPLRRVHATALKKLERYPWPGNIRELAHAVERTVIMSDSPVLQPSDFLLFAPETGEEGLMLERYNLEEVEKAVIRKAIRKHEGNLSQVAKELGLTRTSLYRRLEKYGL
ncbi:MAG: sigma-54-dependent Fis family transcriptional regulator [Candidatus Handelsmanbacteria bacterium RIFCSPLOWO2_12_FULL_64_10]|uniref:Sigma-54-dependent Fis family transcriptional regulator n=1 Tax=Handelsmanbacteria sp. (strain RIFCSPLOWO2_12_FULL_64_10) TaxID=1817868 RepID=A0A1F6CYT8_HANXR|nr:MAG: sigma-54-dependent Fis family transcriptional regulator [Candidatus Handelsmanbacteria bacterium RIFCSPLOWO2_12_FULL_64_10]